MVFWVTQPDINLTQSLLVAYYAMFKWVGLESLGLIVAFA
jgi:hypothetical protein